MCFKFTFKTTKCVTEYNRIRQVCCAHKLAAVYERTRIYPVGAGIGAELLEQFELAYRRRGADGALLRVLARAGRRRPVAAALPPQPVLHRRGATTLSAHGGQSARRAPARRRGWQ